MGCPSMREDDGVCVEVHDLFGLELTESFSVEFESGPAGGEARHENVDVDLNGFFVLDVFVDQFDHLVVHDTKGLNFSTVIGQQGMKPGGGRNGFDLTLVPLLPVLAPEAVEHHFGQRPPTGIF